MPTGGLSLALFCCYLFFGAMPYGGIAAAFQEITLNRMRGQVSAIYMFGLNIMDIGIGPTIVALISRFYGGDLMISRGISTVIGIMAGLPIVSLLPALTYYRRVIVAMKA